MPFLASLSGGALPATGGRYDVFPAWQGGNPPRVAFQLSGVWGAGHLGHLLDLYHGEHVVDDRYRPSRLAYGYSPSDVLEIRTNLRYGHL